MEIQKDLRRRRHRMESYDQKLEQRAAKHEFLRDRNNVTTCRSPGYKLEADWKSEMQQKRQMEFQRRRQIVQAATHQADEKESNKETKVTMRTNRQRATWITSPPLHGAGGKNKIGQLHSDVSQTFPHTPQQPSLRKSMDISDKGPEWPSNVNQSATTEECLLSDKDLVQLSEYLQDALWREDSLKQKLAILQHTTSTLLLSHDNVWKRLSSDGTKKLLLQSEQQRQELEEMAVAALQRVTDQKTKAQDRAHSLKMALQTAKVESSQCRERYEEERRKCAQLRTSLVQNIDHINLLQSQLEKVMGQEATLESQLLQQKHTEAELHLKINLLEDNLHTCRTQLETWRHQDTKIHNKKQSMMEANVDRSEVRISLQFPFILVKPRAPSISVPAVFILRCCPWFILTLFMVVMVVAILTLLLVNIPTTRNQLWVLYQVLQEHTEKYCYRPI
ncbi:unnamed protein product [Coregonus sp. 'balchen']|nr:unnamed protein product [Coregonus sp. 'balchen']